MASDSTPPQLPAKPMSYSTAVASDKRSAIAILLFCIFAGLAYYFFLPAAWQAKATLLLSDDEAAQNPLAALQNQGPNPLDVIGGVATSFSSLKELSERTKVPFKQLQTDLASNSAVSQNQLIITYQDRSKAQAQKVVQTLVDILGERTRDLQFTKAGRQAQFVLQALRKSENELEQSEARVLAYQQRMKTAPSDQGQLAGLDYVRQYKQWQFDLDKVTRQLELARQSARTVAERGVNLPTGQMELTPLRNRLLELQFEARKAQVTYGPASPEVIRTQQEMEAAKRELETEVRKWYKSVQGNVDNDIAALESQRLLLTWQVAWAKEIAQAAPVEALQLARLSREVKTQQDVVAALRSRYEQTRIDAEAEQVKWTLLDSAHIDPEDRPVNKRLGVTLFFSFFIAVAIITFRAGRRVSSSQTVIVG